MRSPIKDYFLVTFDGLWTAVRGMQVTLSYLFMLNRQHRPVTMLYPEVEPDIPEGYRGRHVYVKEKCIACRMCVRECPVDAITMEIEGKGKSAVVHGYVVDYTRCLLCNLCAEVCPVDCLWLGPVYDLTTYSREACRQDLIDPDNADLDMPEGAKSVKPAKPPKPAKKTPAAKAAKPAPKASADAGANKPEATTDGDVPDKTESDK